MGFSLEALREHPILLPGALQDFTLEYSSLSSHRETKQGSGLPHPPWLMPGDTADLGVTVERGRTWESPERARSWLLSHTSQLLPSHMPARLSCLHRNF